MAVSRPQPWSLIGLAISIPSAWRAATSLSRMAWAPLIMGGILAVTRSVVRRATPGLAGAGARDGGRAVGGRPALQGGWPHRRRHRPVRLAHPGRSHFEDA